MTNTNTNTRGNIGAVHMGTKNFEGALHAFQEALRIRRTSWKMWENYRQVLNTKSFVTS